MKFTKAAMTKKDVPAKLNNFKFEPEIDKMGKIAQVLTKNQKILVQVAKEPISTKGPRLSCELSLAGRYIVLVPFSNTVSVSRQISDNDEKILFCGIISPDSPLSFNTIVVSNLSEDISTNTLLIVSFTGKTSI